MTMSKTRDQACMILYVQLQIETDAISLLKVRIVLAMRIVPAMAMKIAFARILPQLLLGRLNPEIN